MVGARRFSAPLQTKDIGGCAWTTKKTKRRLASYRSLRLEVDNQLDRLARLRNEEQLPAMRESSGAKSTGGNGDRMERAILRRMAYEERVLPKIEAAQNDNSTTVIVAPLTRAKIKRPYPMQFDICIPDGLISRVLCEQLITIDKCQLEDRIYRLQADELEKLDRCLKISLGL